MQGRRGTVGEVSSTACPHPTRTLLGYRKGSGDIADKAAQASLVKSAEANSLSKATVSL